MKTLTKSTAPFQIKATDDAARTFTGLASTWGQDLGGDVIEKGAFKRTLKNWKSSKTVLPLIDQHNYSSVLSVIGKMTEAQETDEGLEATFELLEGPQGDEVYRRIKGGYVTGLSIGYEAIQQRKPTEEQQKAGAWRILQEVKLVEVSVVIWPMNTDARIDSVKSLLSKKATDVTPDEREQLVQLHAEIGALLTATAPEPEVKGLAPEDPSRLAVEELLREITLRGLGTPV